MTSVIERKEEVPEERNQGPEGIFRLARPEILEVEPYAPGKPIEEARRELGLEGPIIKLASNENPFGPTEPVRRALTEALEQIHRYPDGGCWDVTRELASYHACSPERVFPGNGSNAIIDLLVRAFVGPGDEVVYPHPSFMVYGPICQINAGTGVPVPLCRDRLDLKAMARAVGPRTKLVLVCNPNNPTGTYVTAREAAAFVERVPEEVLVAFDEAYVDFVTARDFPDTLASFSDRPNVLTLRTFSKVFGLAGLRFGYALAHPDVVSCLHKVRQPFPVNRLAQAGAVAALQDRPSYLERVEILLRERTRVRDALLGLGCGVPPSQANFFLVRPPSPDPALVERLLHRGIIVRAMSPLGYDPEVFRVSIGTPQENDAFLETLGGLIRG